MECDSCAGNGSFFLVPKKKKENFFREKGRIIIKKKRRLSSLLPFGRSEIICGTRWAAAADLIDCPPNGHKNNVKKSSIPTVLLAVVPCLSPLSLSLTFILFLFSSGRITSFFNVYFPKSTNTLYETMGYQQNLRQGESREPPGGESVCFFYDYIFERCLGEKHRHVHTWLVDWLRPTWNNQEKRKKLLFLGECVSAVAPFLFLLSLLLRCWVSVSIGYPS